MINEKRLVDTFIELVKIPSPSREESKLAQYIKRIFEDMGEKPFFDNAGKKVGSNTNNLIIKIKGKKGNPVLLSTHMDTVKPCDKVNPVIDGDIIKSDGTTILGADAKSGIVAIIEAVRILKEKNLSHPPLEIVFTISEEIGLLGAKNLDYSLISAKEGYELDSGDIEKIINRAPGANRLTIKVYGKEAHAGSSPEQGINAIKILSEAITNMQLGRLDRETTANIGTIQGGTATNIVPNYAEAKGEVRSHDEEKLKYYTLLMRKCVWQAVRNNAKYIEGKLVFPRSEEHVLREYNIMRIDEEDGIIRKVKEAGKKAGICMQVDISCGGSDANVFNEHGIKTVVLGTGMSKVHTKEEFIKISDMVKCVEVLVNLLTI